MPKLIRIDRRFGVLNRRLVTDAGGAPCCCDGGGCVCDDAMLLLPFRYASCGGVNNTYFPYVHVPTPAARLITFRLRWELFFEDVGLSTFTRPDGTPDRRRVARLFTSVGTATVCLYRLTGANTYIYTLAAASSAEVNIVSGTPAADVREETNYDATNIPMRVTPFPQEIGWITTPPFNAQRFGLGQPFGCNVDAFQRFPGGNGSEQTQSRRQVYQQTIGQGVFEEAATYTSSVDQRRAVGTERVDWTYTFDRCDGGSNPDAIGGCAGCGDASLLQIL